MADAPLPLTVAIGESVFDLASRVPTVVRPEKMDDNSPALVTQPARVTVIADKQPLPLPTTRFAQIEQLAGVVTAVNLAPMTDFAELEESNELALKLVGHARENGWELVESFPPDLAQMREQLARDPRPRYEKTYALLRRGGVELRISIKEAAGTGLEGMEPPVKGRLFLVNTDFRDDALVEQQTERLFARRKKETGGTQSLPLRVWRTP